MSRKRIALLYAGFAAVLLIATYVVLQKAGVSRAFVENLLAKVIHRERFRLGDANLHLGEGTLTLDQFKLSTEDDPAARPLVAVERIELDVDTNPLGDVGRIRQVRLDGLHLDLDLSGGKTPDFAAILQQGDEPIERENGPPPAIQIVDSRVTLRFSPDAESVEFTDVALELLPDEPGSSRMVLAGSMTSPAGLSTRVSGSGDFATSQFRALIEIEDLELDPALARRFAPKLGEILANAELGGSADKITLWIEYTADPDGGADQLVAGANVEISDLRGVPPGIPYPLFGATARVSASTRENGTVRFTLLDEDAKGNLRVRGELTDCFSQTPIIDAEIAGESLLIGPELLRALRSVPALDRIFNAFEPVAGRFHTTAQIRTSDPNEAPRVEVDTEFDGVDVLWHGLPASEGIHRVDFPETGRNVRGHVRLRDKTVHLDSIRVEAVETVAEINASFGVKSGDAGALEVQIDNVEFSDRLRAAIGSVAPDAVSHYDYYSPRGSTAIRVTVVNRRGDKAPETRVELRPAGASASWNGFPYRLDDLQGLIEIEPRGVAFDLVGERGPTRANLHGRFHRGGDDTTPLRTEFWLNANDVAIDTALRAGVDSLGPEFTDTWKFLSPGGTCDCELTMWRDAGSSPLSYDLRIDARDAEVELEILPLPIRSVNGPLFVHGTGGDARVDIGVVKGLISNQNSTDAADLTTHGSVRTTPQGPTIDVASTAAGLQLTDELRDALHDAEAFNRETWNVIKPTGFVDVIARQIRTHGDAPLAHELSIELENVGSDMAMLPAPARKIAGEVIVQNQVARFRDLRCKMSGADVLCSEGLARHVEGAALFDVTVACDDFPVDDDLANLLSGPIRKTYLDRDLHGRLDINRLDLQFRFPDASEAFELDLRGRFNVRDLRFRLGADFEQVVGLCRIDNSHIDPTGGFVSGRLESGGLSSVGHRINGAQFRFRADPERVELRGVRGRVHNGELFGLGSDSSPDLVYELAGDGSLRTDLGWRDVSLSAALRTSGMQSNEFRGNVSGELHLAELNGGDIVNARGRGELQIAEGRLGVVPLFTAIYSYLSPNRRPRFDGVELDFEFGDQRCDVSNVKLTSPLVSVSGSGSVSMDGYIEMVLELADLFGTDADWLVLPSIARLLTSGVVRFRVFGYLRNPRAQPQWLWESKPSRVPLGPIPGRSRN